MPKEQPKLSECCNKCGVLGYANYPPGLERIVICSDAKCFCHAPQKSAGERLTGCECSVVHEPTCMRYTAINKSAGKRLSEMFGYQGLIMEGNIQKSAEKKIGVNYFPEENPKISDEWAEKKTEESWAEIVDRAIKQGDMLNPVWVKHKLADAEARGRDYEATQCQHKDKLKLVLEELSRLNKLGNSISAVDVISYILKKLTEQ